MEFTAVAGYFSKDKIFDAYTGQLLFKAHTLPHDDHTSSGATSRRRTMVTEVEAAAPQRRVIRWYDTFWIVGGNNTDAFRGEQVRRSFDLKKSTGVMTVLSPAAAALTLSGLSFHAHKEYYKDMTDATTSNDYDVMWNVFCPLSEPVRKGQFLRQGNLIFRVRNVYDTADEYRVAEADQFDFDAMTTAIFITVGERDLVTEQAEEEAITTTVLQTDIQKFYVFRTEAEAVNKPGDKLVIVAKSAVTPVVSMEFVMLGQRWRVVTVVSEDDAWAIRARLA